jgi:hypothetical protein
MHKLLFFKQYRSSIDVNRKLAVQLNLVRRRKLAKEKLIKMNIQRQSVRFIINKKSSFHFSYCQSNNLLLLNISRFLRLPKDPVYLVPGVP